MKTYSTFGERLLARREELGLTQEDLAAKAGITRMAISKIELGMTQKPRADNLFALAKALQLNPNWLVSGKGEKESSHQASFKINNGLSVETLSREVPLISWSQAGEFSGVLPQEGNESIYYSCPVTCSENSFALLIENESMLPRFEPDDIIYVDPELNDPPSGKFVLTRVEGSREAAFKQLQILDNQRYLKTLNPDYPPDVRFIKMNDNYEIIGTVICHMKPV
ncbi:S24 family peptidase [Yersinia alsatica]|uniref:helix-turn-helix domain-containing protein n=1 Tax=Yersinia alsatica TaxID=2890317 RepID=UPI0032EA998D